MKLNVKLGSQPRTVWCRKQKPPVAGEYLDVFEFAPDVTRFKWQKPISVRVIRHESSIDRYFLELF